MGRYSSKVLYFTQILLFCCGIVNSAYAGNFLFSDADISAVVPAGAMWGMFLVGIVLVITSVLGCVGTCYALRDLKANNDGMVTVDDFHVQHCRRPFYCFTCMLVLFFILHASFGMLGPLCIWGVHLLLPHVILPSFSVR